MSRMKSIVSPPFPTDGNAASKQVTTMANLAQLIFFLKSFVCQKPRSGPKLRIECVGAKRHHCIRSRAYPQTVRMCGNIISREHLRKLSRRFDTRCPRNSESQTTCAFQNFGRTVGVSTRIGQVVTRRMALSPTIPAHRCSKNFIEVPIQYDAGIRNYGENLYTACTNKNQPFFISSEQDGLTRKPLNDEKFSAAA